MLELDETVVGRDFTDLLNRVVEGKERVILTRGGKAVAALVPVEDWEERATKEEFHPDPEALQRLDALIAQDRARKVEDDDNSPWKAIKRDPEWQRRWDDVIARIQSHIPPEMTLEEIEAEVRAAHEEVRAERRARGC
jgi:prevent-host-death family protein